MIMREFDHRFTWASIPLRHFRLRLLRAAPGGALDEVLAKERRARAEAALGALPARQREVARLRLFGELSFAEIGVALGIREENARVTFSQARRRLEAALGPGDPS